MAEADITGAPAPSAEFAATAPRDESSVFERNLRRVLIVLIIAGVVLRIAFLTREDLWLDEIWSVQACSQTWDGLIAMLLADNHPLAYHASAKAFCDLIGGADYFTMRLHSLIWGLLGIVTIWGAAKRLLGGATLPLLAAAVLAISPQHLYYSQEARMYSMGGTLMLLAAWAGLELALRAKRGERVGIIVLLGGPVAGAVAANTHYLNMFMLAVFAIALWWFGPRENRAFRKSFFLFWLFTLLVCAPMIIDAFQRQDQIRYKTWWLPMPGPEDLVRTVGRAWMVHQDLILLQVTGGVKWLFIFDLLPLVVLGWVLSRFREVKGEGRFIACVALGAYAATQLIQYSITSMGTPAFYWPRYSSLVLPLGVLGLTPLIMEALRTSKRPALSGGLAAALLLGTAAAGCILKVYPDYGPVRRIMAEHPEAKRLYLTHGHVWPLYVHNIRDPRMVPEIVLAEDVRLGRLEDTIYILTEEKWFFHGQQGRFGLVDSLIQMRDATILVDQPEYRLWKLDKLDWEPPPLPDP